MWGAPSSGKTTFLGALSIALSRRGGKDWNVAGADESSEQVLIKLTTALSRGQTFPTATKAIDQYSWVLHGQVSEVTGKRFRKKERIRPVTVGLDLVDASGEITDPEQVGFSIRKELLEHLVQSRGIVYMFDPIREHEEQDAYDHTFGMLAQLTRRLSEEDGWDGRLPHHVAVCVTKFDEVRVFETAAKMDLLTVGEDSYGFPRVHGDDAQELFRRLCQVTGSGNAGMVPNLLEQYFRPERIRYFVTTAVGFYVNPFTNTYDPDDPQNLLPDEKAERGWRIRGPLHPINVVEPVLWLCHNLDQQGADGNGT